MSEPSEPREKKLKRLNDLRRNVPHVSKSALHQILTDVREHGIPELKHQKAMRESVDLELNACNAYGPLFMTRQLKMTNGGIADFTLVNVLTLLYAAYSAGGLWCSAVQDAVRKTGLPTLSAPCCEDAFLIQWYIWLQKKYNYYMKVTKLGRSSK